MISTIFILFFVLAVICAVIGFFFKEQHFALLSFSGLAFLILAIFSITQGVEFRTGSNVSTSTETFIFTDYPDINFTLGLICLGLALVVLVTSWKALTDKKEREYLEVK